jgi:hypothetical protein
MLTEETSLTEILPNIAAIDEGIAAVRETFVSWSSKQPHIPVPRTRT